MADETDRGSASTPTTRESTSFRMLSRITMTLVAAVAMLALAAPAMAEDAISEGEAYFYGSELFKNGGAACASCHTIAGTDALGGGTLGPDLTSRPYVPPAKGMDAVSPTMAPIFGEGADGALTDAEIAALGAFLVDAAAEGAKEADSGAGADEVIDVELAALGFIGLVVLFGTAALIWGGRMKGVRRNLVNSSKHKNKK